VKLPIMATASKTEWNGRRWLFGWQTCSSVSTVFSCARFNQIIAKAKAHGVFGG
jgi:hypothetical protein